MRRRLAWLLVAPIALVSSQVAHALAYRSVEADAAARSSLLASTGHGYLDYLPFAAALVTVLCALGFVAQVRIGLAGSSAGGVGPRAFALVPLAVFAVQEHFERLAHSGELPLTAVLEPTFLLGLALQIPFAVLAWALARLLLEAARALVHVLTRRPTRVVARDRAPRPPLAVALPRPGILARGYTERGPPLPA
jgi:hypothetical protein